MGQLQQTITLNITGTNKVVRGLDQVGRAAARSGQQADRSSRSQSNLQRNMQGVGRAANNTSRSINNMGGGLRNIQSGMVQLSHYLLILNQRINNTFAKMTRRFTEAESAMTQLKITMGLGGREETSPNFKMFTEAETQIKELAATTEFTTKEVANAFTALVQSGRTPQEVKKFIQNVLQFTTATGGILSLKDSIDITTLTMGTLGGKVEDVEDMLTMLLRTSQKTKIGFTDLRDVLSGARTAVTYFEGEGVDRAADMMVMAAGLKALGVEGRGAGQGLEQFARAIIGMTQAASRNELFKQAGKKGKGRFSVKREQLYNFFGLRNKDILNKARRELGISGGSDKTVMDLFIQSQLATSLGGGKYAQKTANELVTVLLDNYVRLINEKGAAKAKEITTSAFGQQAGMVMLEGLVALAKNSDMTLEEVSGNFNRLKGIIKAQEYDLIRAQTEASKTLAYKTKLLDSALNNLSNTMFKHDIVAVSAVDTYKEMISAIGVLMGKNDSLASSTMAFGRAAQFLTSVGANLGFTLVAMATFSMGVTHALSTAGLATAGLGTTLRLFGRTFLLPTMTILFQFAGALGAVGVAAVALVRYFDTTERKTESVANTFNKMLNKMRDSAKAVGGMINLVFSKDYGNKGIRKTIDEFYANNARMVKLQKELEYYSDGTGTFGTSNMIQRYDPTITEKLKAEYDELFDAQSKLKAVLKKSGYEGLYALEDGSKGVALGLASVVDAIRNLARGLTVIFEASLIPVFHTLDVVISVVSTTMNLMLTPVYALVKALGLASDEASAHKELLKGLGAALGILVSALMVKGAFTFFIFSLRTIQGLFLSLGAGIKNFAMGALTIPMSVNPATASQQGFNTVVTQATQVLHSNTVAQNTNNTAKSNATKFSFANMRATQQLNNALNSKTQILHGAAGALGVVGMAFSMYGAGANNSTAATYGMYVMLFSALMPALVQFYGVLKILRGAMSLTAISAFFMNLSLAPILITLALIAGLVAFIFGRSHKMEADINSSISGVPKTPELVTTSKLVSSQGIDAPRVNSPMVSAPGAYTMPTYVATGGERSVDNSTTTHITIQKMELKTNARNLPQLTKSITRQVGKPAMTMSGVDSPN